ncbi:MAG: LytR C-terminal domain-containing protein, partial [Actinomycetota bacterium]|nr:LytR C-terminal domain-containing protein [Actinomycetota bacterium]
LIYPDGVATAIVQVDYAAIPGFVRLITGRAADPTMARAAAASPSSVTLDVLNGTRRYKLATRNAAQLERLGFSVDVIDSTPDPVTATSVLYRPGQQAAAKAVSRVVVGAKLVETTSVRRVTLELGSDGLQVRGLLTAGKPTTGSKSVTTARPAVSCID